MGEEKSPELRVKLRSRKSQGRKTPTQKPAELTNFLDSTRSNKKNDHLSDVETKKEEPRIGYEE